MRLTVASRALTFCALLVPLHACHGKGSAPPDPAAPAEVLTEVRVPALERRWCGAIDADPAAKLLPLRGAFELLPPYGPPSARSDPFDAGLVDAVRVVLCSPVTVDECTPIRELPSTLAQGGGSYRTDVVVDEAQAGSPLRLRFYVGELELARYDFTPRAAETLPVSVSIHPNPILRAVALSRAGQSPTDVAAALATEFSLSPAQIGWILVSNLSAPEVYRALVARPGAGGVLEADAALGQACVEMDDHLRHLVQQFAPVLRFDQVHWGLPMSADLYYQVMLQPAAIGTGQLGVGVGAPQLGSYCVESGGKKVCGAVEPLNSRDETKAGMSNNDFGTLARGEVPTYYSVHSDGEGRLRISYWWFYGFQFPCNEMAEGPPGSHHGDWEHVVVTTTPDRQQIAAVTYFMHGAWYTRAAGGFSTEAGRPVVYVGKRQHGSYHGQEHSGYGGEGLAGNCCEFADYRNPSDGSVWSTVQDNLVSLTTGGESWMAMDHINGQIAFQGQSYTIAPWSWGPGTCFCKVWLPILDCVKAECNTACGTHPTTEVFAWTSPSCTGVGCDIQTGSCWYSGSYDQGWPY